MAERPQNPRPMGGCAAGFHPDHRRRKRLEENDHLLAPQLLTQNHLLGGVHPMKLEKMFRRVHANSANLFHGRSPLFEICNDLILAQSMPSGAVHPITQTGPSRWSRRVALLPFAGDLKRGHPGARRPSRCEVSTPQNLTSGRRLSWQAPKFLILEVIGLGKGGTNLYHGV